MLILSMLIVDLPRGSTIGGCHVNHQSTPFPQDQQQVIASDRQLPHVNPLHVDH